MSPFINSTPTTMARNKGAKDARAGKPMKPDIHWPKEAREAYRAAYIRNNNSKHS